MKFLPNREKKYLNPKFLLHSTSKEITPSRANYIFFIQIVSQMKVFNIMSLCSLLNMK